MLRGTLRDCVSNGEAGAANPSLEWRRNLLPMYKALPHNICRHSHATRVEITIERTHRNLLRGVRDDGVGFDERLTRSGNGLMNLRRRTADLRGTLDIRSAPGAGTQVTVSAPLP